MTKKILTDLDATNRTITASSFPGTYFGTETGTIGSTKNTWLGGTSGASPLTSGVTATTSINSIYSVAGTVVTNIHGGYSIGSAGISTITLGNWSNYTSGAVSTINLGGSGVAAITTTNIYGVANLAGTTSPLQLNTSAGTSGQVLTSAGSGSTPTWTDVGYTLISSVAFSGSAPSFSSIPQTYKKLVVQIIFSAMGTFNTSLNLSVNSGATTSSTMYSTGSTTSTISTAGTSFQITAASVSPTVGDLMTVEIPNYTGTRPTVWISGGTGASAQSSRWGVGSTSAAITQMTFAASTSWGSAAGTAYLYGVD